MPRSGRVPVRQMVPLGSLSVAVWVVVLSLFAIIGSDLLWVVALGDLIRETGSVPVGVPFATAPQVQWHNPLVVAEVLLTLVNAAGPWALTAFHLLLVALALGVTTAEARRLGGSEARTALVVSLVVIGGSTAFVIARLPSLSLVPFAVLVALLRRQDASASGVRRLWWVVLLVALWGNLHGGVLVGVAVLGIYLVVSPGAGSVIQRLSVGAGAGVALLATSAGVQTPAYYVGVITNEAAARHTELWARPDLANPLDVAMLGCAAVLLVLFGRSRPPLWEWLVAAVLLGATVMGARNGVWLLLFVAPRAAAPRSAAPAPERSGDAGTAEPETSRRAVALAGIATLVGVAAVGVVLTLRGDAVHAPGSDVVAEVSRIAGGRVVLASEPLAETLAQGGVQVWASNPIDAFPRAVQADFLDFLGGGPPPPSADVDLLVVPERDADASRTAGWRPVSNTGGYVVLERNGSS
jgi:hypothetical protein